jgi:hypothetical protein
MESIMRNKAEEIFSQLLSQLVDQAINLNSKFDLLWYLTERRSDSLSSLNRAHVFFRIVFDSLITDCLITLSRLFENRKDTLNLMSFLKYVERHRPLFSQKAVRARMKWQSEEEFEQWFSENQITDELLADHRKKFSDMVHILTRLKKRRDNFVAHFASEYMASPLKKVENLPVTLGEMKGLLEFLNKAINIYSIGFNGCGRGLLVDPRPDADHILQMLKASPTRRPGVHAT